MSDSAEETRWFALLDEREPVQRVGFRLALFALANKYLAEQSYEYIWCWFFGKPHDSLSTKVSWYAKKACRLLWLRCNQKERLILQRMAAVFCRESNDMGGAASRSHKRKRIEDDFGDSVISRSEANS